MDIEFATADLCDSYSDSLSIAEPFFRRLRRSTGLSWPYRDLSGFRGQLSRARHARRAGRK